MRFETELSLRFVGDEAECQQYISRARTVLGEVWNRDIVLGGLEQSWRSVRLDNRATVHVYATRHTNPIITIVVDSVESEETLIDIADLRLAWLPEGLVFTPVSEEYEDGWGLPTRNHETGAVLANTDPLTGDTLHPIGSVGGIWPQVILNKFANNKYLDDAAFVTGVPDSIVPTLVADNPLLRETWDAPYNIDNQTRFNSWQLLYNPLDCIVDLDDPADDPGTEFWATDGNTSFSQIPGLYDEASYSGGRLQAPQFGGYLVNDLIFEPPSDAWHSHRAEEILYYTPAQEAIFQHTNTLRADVGLGRMHRMVRGHANTARLSVSEIALSGKQFHDSVEFFRPGYAYVEGRARSAKGISNADGENLLITTSIGLDWDAGSAVATAWETSPVHYANMTDPLWTTAAIPGAEHFIDFLGATVDETVSSGVLPDPISGLEWAQIFSLSSTWVPVPFNYNISESGSVGNYGKVGHYDRDTYYGKDFLFISYRQVLYAIPNDLFDTPACMGVFGANEYVDADTGQRRLRAVLGTTNYMLEPPPGYIPDYKEFTLYVITAPLANTSDCDWESEAEITYGFDDGWIPAMEGRVKFSPDGQKFVFTMLQRMGAYTEALDYNATDFTSDYSALYNPRRAVALNHIVFNSVRLAGEWFTENQQLPLTALVNCSSSGTPGLDVSTYYRRTLNGELNAFPDWDDDNNLIYIKLVIDEKSDQYYEEYAPLGQVAEASNYMYTIRKMVFPSGKEIIYHQQYMRDVLTVENPAELALNGWPAGDGTADPFFLMFHYINTRDEDVVYTRRETRIRLALQDGSLYPTTYEYGVLSIHFDGGWDEFDPITSERINERQQETLYSEAAGFFNSYNAAADGVSEFVDGEGYTGLYMDSSLRVYQTDVVVPAARSYTLVFDNSPYPPIVIPVRAYLSVPMPGVKVGADADEATEGKHVRGAYNAYPRKTVDNLIGRPPFAAYSTSAIYGIQQRLPEQYLGTNFFWGSSIWNDSFMPTNIAPIINSEYASLCQVVRYEGRVMLRLENRKWPWATVRDFTEIGTVPGLPTPIVLATDEVPFKPDWDTVPEAAQLLVWANFDLDEAAGISDVTDIQPFGRVG